jgi:hypothetical protein
MCDLLAQAFPHMAVLLYVDISYKTCPSHCFLTRLITNALESLPGVEKAIIPGWQSPRVTEIVDEGVSPTALIDAVAAAGYKASLAKQETG